MVLETDALLVHNMAVLPALGWAYGEYLGTYKSEHGQVGANLYRKGDKLVAHIFFPTGLDGTTVSDRYVTDLWDYAREQGFKDRPQLIYS